MEMLKKYQVLGLGGLTIFMENYDYLTVTRALLTARRILPMGKPLHLFGAGHPLIITLAAALGADTFDSASYILYARDNRYITDYGVERLDRLEYFPCNCPICSKHTPEELLEMEKEERIRLLAIHNLHAISKAIKRVKQAIREGRLWELLEEISRRHPAAYEAFRFLGNYREFLEEGAPRSKGVVRGLRFYGVESTWHPKVTAFRERLRIYLSERRVAKIKLLPYPEDPSDCKPEYEDEVAILYYTPYLGVVPSELCGVYPTIHFDYPKRVVPEEVLKDAAEYILTLLKEHYEDTEVEIARSTRDDWSRRLYELLKMGMEGEG
jgi:7-cyano-7-deazaguanine tRNA-ribosyltransferase